MACPETTPKDVAEMAWHALKLLQNAFSTISADRRQKATRYLNRELCHPSKRLEHLYRCCSSILWKGVQ